MTAIAPDTASVEVLSQGDATRVAVRGRLTAPAVPSVWGIALDPIRRTRPRRVIVDATGVTYCDGAGLAFFAQIRRTAAMVGAQVVIEGLAPELRDLVQLASLPDPLAPQLRPAKPLNPVSQIGNAALNVFDDVRAMIAFLGQLLAAITWALLHPRQLRWRDLLEVAEKAGANAVAVVCLLGSLIGLILAFQSAIPMQRYGATEVIPIIVSVAVVRELGPLIACILLAGRSGSAFAAEIGTMKVTEEISALQTLGLDPVRFLVVPRVLAVMIVTPLLSVFCSLMGVVGGYTVMANYGFTIARYASTVRQALTYQDFCGGVAKSVVFAFIIGGIGCLRGLRTGAGPGAVGDSTTRAVVAGIVLVIVVDGIFGVTFYYLGI
jgi:phospholipid/cholesterol/gamma-HCH transport system permease protein